jgi:hypothetical protein
VRAPTETTRFKVSETNLRLLETESSGQNKRYVYITRVRPGSIPNATSTSRAVWATRKELISARRTGYLVRGDQQSPLRYKTFGKPIDGWINKNVRLEDNVLATLHVSIAQSGTSMFVLEGTLRGHRCRTLVDSGASENFCKVEWVREHHIPTVSGEKYRRELADGSTTTTRQRLRNEVLTVGTLDIRLDAIMTQLDKFDIILGQPWLQAVNPDIDWSIKTIRDRKTCKAMVSGDEYTVHVVVHHLEADAMAKLLRQQPADLFVIELREVRHQYRSTTRVDDCFVIARFLERVYGHR